MTYDDIQKEIDRLFKEKGWTWKEAADFELIAKHFLRAGQRDAIDTIRKKVSEKQNLFEIAKENSRNDAEHAHLCGRISECFSILYMLDELIKNGEIAYEVQ